jgi:hypothetical protein
MLSTLLKCPAVVSHDEHHADARHRRDDRPDTSRTGWMPRPERETGGEWNQHEHDERSSNLHWIDGDAFDQQRKDERHVPHGDDHEHDHQADGKRHVAFRQIRQLDEERGTGRNAAEQQAHAEWFIKVEDSGKRDCGKGRQHEIGQQGKRDQPAVSQWSKNLIEGEAQSNGQCARQDEHQD